MSAAASFLAWSGFGWRFLAASLFVFLAWRWAATRRSGYAVGFLYYLVALRDEAPAIQGFRGDGHRAESLVFWIGSALLLALPFGLFWSRNLIRRGIGACLTLLATAIPGWGFLSPASPLVAAGSIFPYSHWLGLLGVVALAFALISVDSRHVFGYPLLGLVIVPLIPNPSPIPGWAAISLGTKEMASRNSLLDRWAVDQQVRESLQAAALDQKVQTLVRESTSPVTILPEAVVPAWQEVQHLFWNSTLATMRSQGRAVIFGAGSSSANGLVLCDQDCTSYQQRIPVPLGLRGSGISSHWQGPGTVEFRKHRLAVLICWEQLLVYPVLASFAERPDSLLAVSSLYWAPRTRINRIQQDCVDAWSRLFGVPALRAVRL